MPLLLCPNCNASMQQINRDEVQIDMCTQCRGVWLDRGELEKLLGGIRQAESDWQREREYFSGKYRDDDDYKKQPHYDEHHYKKHKKHKSPMHRFLDMFD